MVQHLLRPLVPATLAVFNHLTYRHQGSRSTGKYCLHEIFMFFPGNVFYILLPPTIFPQIHNTIHFGRGIDDKYSYYPTQYMYI
jgi:hypothetical protein